MVANERDKRRVGFSDRRKNVFAHKKKSIEHKCFNTQGKLVHFHRYSRNK